MYVRRKVYSYSEPQEQLYSVTMTESELSLFSDFMDELNYSLFSREEQEKGRDLGQLVGGGAGLAAGGALTYGGLKYAEGVAKDSKSASKALIKSTEDALKNLAADKADAIAKYKNATAQRQAVMRGNLSEQKYLKRISSGFDKQISKVTKDAQKASAKLQTRTQIAKAIKKLPKGAKIGAGVGLGLTGAYYGSKLGRPIGGVVASDF
nr:MAG TPA: hypothetical protein [Caudoviricetes sp.]